MRDLIFQINQEMRDFTLNPQVITDFIEKIKELQQQNSPIVRIICEDDIQVLKLARLFISKLLIANSSRNNIEITGEDWRQENIEFSLIKFWVDDFELNRIINYKSYAIGGYAGFNIVRKRDLLRYIYDEIKAVINNLRLGTESDASDQIQEDTFPASSIGCSKITWFKNWGSAKALVDRMLKLKLPKSGFKRTLSILIVIVGLISSIFTIMG